MKGKSLHPYHFQRVQALTEVDYPHQVRRVRPLAPITVEHAQTLQQLFFPMNVLSHEMMHLISTINMPGRL